MEPLLNPEKILQDSRQDPMHKIQQELYGLLICSAKDPTELWRRSSEILRDRRESYTIVQDPKSYGVLHNCRQDVIASYLRNIQVPFWAS